MNSNESTQRNESMKIGLYQKTKHFAMRQKERNISDNLLTRVLCKIKCSFGIKTTVIVGEHFLKSYKNLFAAPNLVLIIESYDLVTIYPTNNLYGHSYQNVYFIQ
ncbi:MAG: hypothetical protein J6T48_05515 [Bacteroidales bacterium]|nr:hypothetical protein [Bacteroidales bacterium]